MPMAMAMETFRNIDLDQQSRPMGMDDRTADSSDLNGFIFPIKQEFDDDLPGKVIVIKPVDDTDSVGIAIDNIYNHDRSNHTDCGINTCCLSLTNTQECCEDSTEVNSVECKNYRRESETHIEDAALSVKGDLKLTVNDDFTGDYNINRCPADDLKPPSSSDTASPENVELKVKLGVNRIIIPKNEKLEETNENGGNTVAKEEIQSDSGAGQEGDNITEIHLIVSRDSENVKKSFKCIVCGRSHRGRNLLTRHMKIHKRNHNQLFICEECGKVFFRRKFLQEHQKQVHIRKLSYTCKVCGHRCGTKVHLKTHLKMHKDEKKVHGNIEEYVRRNFRSLRDVAKYPCAVCGKTFRVRRCLNKHMTTHPNIEACTNGSACNIQNCLWHCKKTSCLFICRICHKGYKTSHRREKHMKKAHREEGPHLHHRRRKKAVKHKTHKKVRTRNFKKPVAEITKNGVATLASSYHLDSEMHCTHSRAFPQAKTKTGGDLRFRYATDMEECEASVSDDFKKYCMAIPRVVMGDPTVHSAEVGLDNDIMDNIKTEHLEMEDTPLDFDEEDIPLNHFKAALANAEEKQLMRQRQHGLSTYQVYASELDNEEDTPLNHLKVALANAEEKHLKQHGPSRYQVYT